MICDTEYKVYNFTFVHLFKLGSYKKINFNVFISLLNLTQPNLLSWNVLLAILIKFRYTSKLKKKLSYNVIYLKIYCRLNVPIIKYFSYIYRKGGTFANVGYFSVIDISFYYNSITAVELVDFVRSFDSNFLSPRFKINVIKPVVHFKSNGKYMNIYTKVTKWSKRIRANRSERPHVRGSWSKREGTWPGRSRVGQRVLFDQPV